jgi:hypothetical protein
MVGEVRCLTLSVVRLNFRAPAVSTLVEIAGLGPGDLLNFATEIRDQTAVKRKFLCDGEFLFLKEKPSNVHSAVSELVQHRLHIALEACLQPGLGLGLRGVPGCSTFPLSQL